MTGNRRERVLARKRRQTRGQVLAKRHRLNYSILIAVSMIVGRTIIRIVVIVIIPITAISNTIVLVLVAVLKKYTNK